MYHLIRLRKSVCAAAVICLFLILGSTFMICAVDRPAEATTSRSGTEEAGIDLPIIMYHSLLKEEKRQGKFVVSPDTFEQDLLYLKDKGYTTIVIQDLINYVRAGTPLPKKPIMLTFDDGYYNNYVYAYPLLKKYGCKMVLSAVGSFTEEYSRNGDRHANYSYVTWADLKEMISSGLVEVQNHTYDMHGTNGKRKGAMKVSGETLDHYKSALSADITKMQTVMKEQTGYAPTAFTYPFGAVSKEALPILKELGFQATLVCESRINHITRNPECLFGLGRYLRPAGVESAVYFSKTVKLTD